MEENKAIASEYVSLSKKLRYSIGTGGYIWAYILYSALITYYFTDILCIGAAAAGTLLLVSRIWDGINDPMMGILIDRTDTKWGKCRPYILAGGIWLSVSTGLLFYNPGFESTTAKLIWAYVIYNSWGMAYTMYKTSVNTLTKRITTTGQGIVEVNSWGFGGMSIASMIFSSTLMTLIAYFSVNGDTSKGYQMSGILAGVVLFITMWCFFSLRENQTKEVSVKPEHGATWKAILHLFKNKHYMGFCLSAFLVLLGYYLSASTMMYYCIYHLGDADKFSLLTTIDYATPIVAAFIMPHITKKMEKRTIMIYAVLLACLAYGLRWLTGDPNVVIMTTLAIVAGIGCGIFNVLFTPAALDCAVYGEYTSGVKTDALYVSSFSMFSKICTGIGGAVVGYALDACGYVPNAAAQSDHVMSVIMFLCFGGLVIGCIGGAVALFAMYKLKNADVAMMQEAIAQRNGQQA